IPAQATAPALVIVGFYMMSVARDIPWENYEEAIPAFVTMLVMPFTWSITNGIGAGFVTFTTIKLLSGQGRRVHWMVYAASLAFAQGTRFAVEACTRRRWTTIIGPAGPLGAPRPPRSTSLRMVS